MAPTQGTRLTAAQRAAKEQYVEEYGRLLDPNEARDRCWAESYRFMECLANYEVEATIIDGFHFDQEDPNLILAGHSAVQVGDDVWDWTARQFDPDAPVPKITPVAEWRAEWKTL